MSSTLRQQLLKKLEKLEVHRVKPMPVEKRSTGIISLDLNFHGGLPVNRFLMYYGEKNSGKSTMSLLFMRAYIARGEPCALLDAENSFDMDYALKLGLDPNAVDANGDPLLDIYRATTAEQWFEALREIIAAKHYKLIVIDTLAKFVPSVEFESPMDKGTMGVMPRLGARFARVVGPLMYNADCTVLILNQERLDIGNAVHSYVPKNAPGGKALIEHEPSIIVYMLSPKDAYDKEAGRNQKLIFRYKIEKSKLFEPMAKGEECKELHIATGKDSYEVDYGYELFYAATHFKLLKNSKGEIWSGNNAYFEGQLLGNGEKAIIAFLGEPSDLRDRLEAAVMERLELQDAESPETAGNPNADQNDPEPVSDTESSDAD